MQEKMSVKQKILQYIDKKGITLYQFYKESGITRGVLTNPAGISEDNIRKFIEWAKDLNIRWLFDESTEYLSVREPEVVYHRSKKSHEGYPLIPVETFAGIASNAEYSISADQIEERYIVPLFEGKGVDFLIPVRGSSMYPKYNSGDIVACRVIKDQLFIQWGKCYVLDTKSQGSMVKRLKKSDKPEYVVCKSDNQQYEDFEVPVTDIRSMALVVGVIRLE